MSRSAAPRPARSPLVRLGFALALAFAFALPLCPSALDAQAPSAHEGESANAPAPVPHVNLNTATAAELERLPGVGPARALAIVAYRERRPFRRIQELMRIRGIGRKTFRRLRPMLTLEGPTTL